MYQQFRTLAVLALLALTGAPVGCARDGPAEAAGVSYVDGASIQAVNVDSQLIAAGERRSLAYAVINRGYKPIRIDRAVFNGEHVARFARKGRCEHEPLPEQAPVTVAEGEVAYLFHSSTAAPDYDQAVRFIDFHTDRGNYRWVPEAGWEGFPPPQRLPPARR